MPTCALGSGSLVISNMVKYVKVYLISGVTMRIIVNKNQRTSTKLPTGKLSSHAQTFASNGNPSPDRLIEPLTTIGTVVILSPSKDSTPITSIYNVRSISEEGIPYVYKKPSENAYSALDPNITPYMASLLNKMVRDNVAGHSGELPKVFMKISIALMSMLGPGNYVFDTTSSSIYFNTISAEYLQYFIDVVRKNNFPIYMY
jgi:hypothetical protein